MKMLKTGLAATVLIVMTMMIPPRVSAHCDGMDGPVVNAARKALETGNVNRILIWVQKNDEAEVVSAFQRTLAVRKLSAEARELADMYFFETVVRIHRAGEGEPYTGLKPAGRDLGPAIPAADKAIEQGSVESLVTLLTHSVEDGIRKHFEQAVDLKKFDSDDVEAGRRYVAAYVQFIHYVERIHETMSAPAHGHEAAEHDNGHGHGP